MLGSHEERLRVQTHHSTGARQGRPRSMSHLEPLQSTFDNALDGLADLAAITPRMEPRDPAAVGLSIDTGEWRANIRASNTEPLLRLNVEARDLDTVSAALEELGKLLGMRVQH